MRTGGYLQQRLVRTAHPTMYIDSYNVYYVK